MSMTRALVRAGAVIALAAASVVPARATTLIRMGLDDLVGTNATVVVGRVLDVYSHWNAEGTFILSDVRVVADDVLKGDTGQREFTITVMGGTVGDLSTVIVGGPEIEVGRTYVLFLDANDLPGAPQARTVRDLCQGIYDVEDTPTGPRAVSQASRHPLLADGQGNFEEPGGSQGIPLDEMIRQVRQLAGTR